MSDKSAQERYIEALQEQLNIAHDVLTAATERAEQAEASLNAAEKMVADASEKLRKAREDQGKSA